MRKMSESNVNLKASFSRRALMFLGTILALGAGMPETVRADPLTHVRIGFQKYGTLLLLKATGDLEKRLAAKGIGLSWAEFQGGVKLLEALSLGSIDIGSTGDAPPIIAQAVGASFVYFGVEPPSPKGEAIVVPESSPIQSVADLRGKRIASNRGGNAHYLAIRALQSAGLTSKDVEWSWLFPADARPALERGAIDAWAVWDPFLASVQTDLKVRVIADGASVGVPNFQFYLASSSFARAHPDIITIILEEIEKVDRAAVSNLSQVVKTVAASTGIKEGAVQVALERMGYGVRKPDTSITESQQKLANVFFTEGLITKSINVDDVIFGAKSQ